MGPNDSFRLLDELTALAATVFLLFLGWLTLHLERVVS